MKKKKAYLSGPMSGHPDWNFPAFQNAAEGLRTLGWEILNPAEWEDCKVQTHAECLRFDILKLVQEPELGYIILLPGWLLSKGATVELAVALALGLTPLVYNPQHAFPYQDYGTAHDPVLYALDNREVIPELFWQSMCKEMSNVVAMAGVLPAPTPLAPVESVCQEADRLVSGDRGADYGHPLADFSRTAKIWEAILGFPVSAPQVGLCMIGVKISRECNKHKRDNLADTCGYAKCVDMIETKLEEQRSIVKKELHG